MHLIKISYFHPCSFYRWLFWKFFTSVPHHPGSMWNMMMGMWMRVRMVMIVFLMDRFHPWRFLIFLINPPCFPVSRSGIVYIGRIILSVRIVITGWTFGYIFVVLNRYKTFKTPTLLAVIFVKRHCYSFYFKFKNGGLFKYRFFPEYHLKIYLMPPPCLADETFE